MTDTGLIGAVFIFCIFQMMLFAFYILWKQRP